LFCKKNITVAKSTDVKTELPNLEESSKEGHGSKGAILPVMMMIMMMFLNYLI
jgi:hypothetical protein